MEGFGEGEQTPAVGAADTGEHDCEPRHEEARPQLRPPAGVEGPGATQIEQLFLVLAIHVQWEMAVGGGRCCRVRYHSITGS